MAVTRDAMELSDDVRTRIVQAQEAERSRLAQEVHDGPAQALTNAIFQVEYIEKVLDQDAALARAELRYLGQQLRRDLGDVRSFLSQLRPRVLVQLGLEGALREIARNVAMTGVSIDVTFDRPIRPLDDNEQTVVLRVAQEALQNVRKHAGAHHVRVAASQGPDAWTLEVHDDGRGFDVTALQPRGQRSFGLQFMRERAELIGAGFEVVSRPDGGTLIRLAIPTREESR